jgi:hypothetical protein
MKQNRKKCARLPVMRDALSILEHDGLLQKKRKGKEFRFSVFLSKLHDQQPVRCNFTN